MMIFIAKYDFYHISNFRVFADINDEIHVNNTIEIELAGINIAAIKGFNSALTAKNKPIKL